MRTNRGPRVRAAVSGAALAAGAVAAHARFVAPFHPRIREERIDLSPDHAGLDGLTVAFVTDTHVGPQFPPERLDPTIQLLAGQQPDILLFGGDYICESPRFWRQAIPGLCRMVESSRYGAWGISGNHDLANTRRALEESLGDANIRLLNNASAEIQTDRGSLWVAGLDDVLLGKANVDAAFADIPRHAPVLALIHEPDASERLVPYQPMAALAGHSHGGQIRLPKIGGLGAPKMGRRFQTGRTDIDGMPLIVSNGIGVYRPPLRFNCSPEVIVVRFAHQP